MNQGFKSYLISILAFTISLVAGIIFFPHSTTSPLNISILDTFSDNLSLSQIITFKETRWQSLKHSNFFRFLDSGDIWLKIQLPLMEEANDDWIVRIPHPIAEQIDFHLLTHTTLIQSQQFNLDQSYATICEWDCDLSFSFPQKAKIPRTLYIRARSAGFMGLPIQVQSAKLSRIHQISESAIRGLYIGGMLGLIFYHLMFLISIRDRVYLYFFAAQCTILLAALGINGHGAFIYLSFLQTNNSRISLAISMIVLGILAIHKFLRSLPENNVQASKEPWLSKILYGSAIGSSIIIYFVPLLNGIALTLTVVVLIYIYEIIWLLQRLSLRACRSAAVGATGNLLCILAGILHYAGVITAIPAFTNIIYIGIIWQAASLAIALSNSVSLYDEQKRAMIRALSEAGASKTLTMPFSNQIIHILNQVRKPREVDITILFVHIAGFREILARTSAARAFQQLGDRLSLIKEIVELNGGFIDRSLTDGLLCVFGVHSRAATQSHAQSAFHAACSMQKISVAKDFESAADPGAKPRDVMPLQIGMHSDLVIAGNIGGSIRVDYTIVGPGVNFASRLAHACAPMRIMMSGKSRERLNQKTQAENCSPIYIAIKHHDELVKAFEIDPLAEMTARTEWISRRYFDQRGYKRLEPRHQILPTMLITLEFEHGTLEVMDLSPLGIRAIGPVTLGNYARIHFQVNTNDEKVNALIREKLLNKVFMEVRWSRRTATGIEHGLKFSGMNRSQRAFLFAALRSLATESLLSEGNSEETFSAA